MQEPGYSGLTDGNLVAIGNTGEHAHGARLGRMATGAERRPRNESDGLVLAMSNHGIGAPVFEVVPILHRHDRGEPLRLLELLEADIGNADVADLAFVA